MNDPKIVGRLVQSSTTQFRFAGSSEGVPTPGFGNLVYAESEPGITVFGVIFNLTWESDAFTAQIATADEIMPTVLATSRRAGQVIDVVIAGYRQDGIRHTLPPRPPTMLEQIYLCQPEEIVEFTMTSFSYLRFLARADITQSADLIAAHIRQASWCHNRMGKKNWTQSAIDYITDYLSADFDLLISVMEAIAQTTPPNYLTGTLQ